MRTVLLVCELLGGLVAAGVVVRSIVRALRVLEAILAELVALRRDLADHERAPLALAHPRREHVRDKP